MARTENVIFEEMAAARPAEITSTSLTGRWALLARIVARTISFLEVLFDMHKSEVEIIAAELKPGTDPWLVKISKDFRYGYDVSVDENYNIQYSEAALADDSALIIKSAAVTDAGGQAVLKVATGTNTVFSALSNDQLIAFVSYIRKRRFAGQSIVIVSYGADSLKLNLSFTYNGLLFSSDVMTAVVDALKQYLLTGLRSDGSIHKVDLEDALQKVPGFKDLNISSIFAKGVGSSYLSFSQSYITRSGYVVLDEGDSIINLIPN